MIQSHTAEVDGVTIHYVEAPGPGPAVFILHGATGSHATFLPLLPDLARNAHIYAIDLRGHNLSGHTPGAYQLPDFGRDVVALIERVAAQPVYVAGHSLGGLIAIWLAAHASEWVRGIFLEDPPLYLSLMPRMQTTGFYAYFRAMREVLPAHHARGGTLEEMIAYVGRSPINAEQTMLEAVGPDKVRLRATQLHRLDPTVLDPLVSGLTYGPDEPDDLLARVRCPIRLLAARVEYGGALDREDLQRAMALAPHCELTVLEQTGHLIHEERSAIYVEALGRFTSAANGAR